MALKNTFSATLDGAAVSVNEGTEVGRTYTFESGDYPTPFWVTFQGTNPSPVVQVSSLPARIYGVGTGVQISSTNPTFVTKTSPYQWDVGSGASTYGIAALPIGVPARPLKGVDYDTSSAYTVYAGPTAGNPGGTDASFEDPDPWTAFSAAMAAVTANTGGNYAGDVTIYTDPGSRYISTQNKGIHVGPGGIWDKTGGGLLTITNTDSSLSQVLRRVLPSDKPNMPQFVVENSGNSDMLYIEPGTSFEIALVGLCIENNPATERSALVEHVTVTAAQGASQFHNGLKILGCYFDTQQTSWSPALKRCIYYRGTGGIVWRNYSQMAQSNNGDSQFILIAQGNTLRIEDNHMGGGAENFILGGISPEFQAAIPQDILIKGNHCYNPLSVQGINPGAFKNGGEFKVGLRVRVEGNVFENGWPGAQVGACFLLKCSNQDANPSQPWHETRDIVVDHNVFMNFPVGMSIANLGDNGPAVGVHKVVIDNNILTNITGKATFPGSNARMIQIIPGTSDAFNDGPNFMHITRNTFDGGNSGWSIEVTNIGANFGATCEISHNVFNDPGNFGPWIASGGNGAISGGHISTSFTAVNNVHAGRNASATSDPTFTNPYFPTSESDIGWLDLANGNFRIDPAKPWAAEGADIDEMIPYHGSGTNIRQSSVRSSELTP